MLRSKIISRIIFFGVLILLMFAYGCTDANVDDPADTTPAPPAEIVETTPTETTLSEVISGNDETKTSKYYYLGDPLLKEDSDGQRYVQAIVILSCYPKCDVLDNGQSTHSARAWLILPDGTKIAAAPTDAKEQNSDNDDHRYIITFMFYGLPDDFDIGKYDFLVSEYDDVTGDGDYHKTLFEDITVGTCTAKYEFALEGELVISEGYQGKTLIGAITCITTCVSGRDYYTSPSGMYYADAKLIAPDGTAYNFNPTVTEATMQVNAQAGDVFKEQIYFEYLPLDLAPGKYDIQVWNTTNGQSERLFEDVPVSFESENTTIQ